MTQTMNIILISISVVVFIWYRQLVIRRFGVQSSYSSSYNLFPSGIQQSYYTIFMWGISVPIMFVSQNILGFFAGAILCIDGAARTGTGVKYVQKMHNLGAQIGIALGMVLIVTFSWWYLIPVGLFIMFTLAAMKWLKNGTWWIEEAAMYVIMSGLIVEKVILF